MFNHINHNIRLISFSLVLSFCLSIVNKAYCNERISFKHYSVADGLSDNVIVSMYQDRNGVMWFGTFAGLNCFDGYTFRSYTASERHGEGLTHNRVDYITEDSYGFLWLITYSGEVQRFDPRTSTFLNVPFEESQSSNHLSPVVKICSFASGAIWLITKYDGAFRVLTNQDNFSLQIDHFGKQNGSVSSSHIYDVYEDTQRNTWLLTANGLIQIEFGGKRTNHFFEEAQDAERKEMQPFFSVNEQDDMIFFGSAHGRIWRFRKQKKDFVLSQLPFSSDVIDIRRLDTGCFLILSSHDGFALYQPNDANIVCFNTQNQPQMDTNQMISSYLDCRGDVWIETVANGVLHLNTKTQTLDNFRVKTDKVSPYLLLPNFRIFEDRLNRLWVHPRGGGFSYYDSQTNQLRPFYNEPGSADRRFSNLIHTALSDSQGNLWMCTYSKGLEKISFSPSDFQLIRPNLSQRIELYDNEIRAVFQDSNNYFWLATKDASLYLTDASFNKLGCLGRDGRLNSKESFQDVIYSIMEDSKGRIWLGTKGSGLYLLTRRQNADLEFDVEHFRFAADDMYSLSSNSVYSILEDERNQIWIGTFGGGVNLLDTTQHAKRFINYRNHLRSYPISNFQKIRFLVSDHQGNIWAATSNGVLSFKNRFDSPGDISFRQLSAFSDSNQLSLDVHYIFFSKSGQMFLATYGGGLICLDEPFSSVSNKYKIYKKESGAPSNIILNLVEDAHANLWMSSANGLLCFNPNKEQFTVYDENAGIGQTDFSEASILRLKDNRIAVGSNAGLYVFDPMRLRKKNFVPKLILTDLFLFNKPVDIHAADSPVRQNIDYASKIVLNHKQSVFSIGFAALDWENAANLEYRYRLRGFEKEWNIMRTYPPRVTYTNIPKGDYVFEVESTNSDGVWVNNRRQIPIEVLPSFWNSTWGYLLYVLGALLLLGLILFVQNLFLRLKNKVVVEQNIANLKLRFFTNISHELRTPLTLIASPIDYLLKQDNLTPLVREQLDMVKRNTDRMLRLVNQILDFRKIQNNKMKLKIERICIGPFAHKVCDNFQSLVQDKVIQFRFIDHSDGLSIWADKDKVEKILFNLLANAFKFTPAGKTIEMEVKRNDASLDIRIQDEGIGMSREKLSHLFERFESADNYNGFQPGTGIGLSLTKELVDMHHASIIADSQLGQGTTFVVSFLLGTKHFEGDVDFIVEDNENPELNDSLIENTSASSLPEIEKQTILIVEDNTDLRSFLRTVLTIEFNVLEAANGKEGLLLAEERLPDIIISDIMMPVMDGLQLTTSLKGNIRTSHIPIVLLTAKTAMEDRLEALNCGADDYITKPFSAEYLEARIRNLLQQRQKLQELFRNTLSFSQEKEEGLGKVIDITPSAPKVVSQDNLFIEHLISLLEENMENSELTVDDFVSMAGLSRSVFFKKLKSLTGLAPIEFIREMRIKRAAQLIETRQYNISQVAYMVGMNDPRYFSRCFKQKYGMTPTEYKEQFAEKAISD